MSAQDSVNTELDAGPETTMGGRPKSLGQFSYKDPLPTSEKVRRAVWNVVWAILFRPTPRLGFRWWRRALLRAFGAKVGKTAKISSSCFIWAPWKFSIGERSALGDNVYVYSMAQVTIGSFCAVSEGTFLCTGTHGTSLSRPLLMHPITIRDYSWVAAQSFVMPGVTIGEGAVIGARSVVTKDMPPWTICVGHPCRPVRRRDPEEKDS
jgi:putative colanic acid biosynthesis acetyltransferase WcaF